MLLLDYMRIKLLLAEAAIKKLCLESKFISLWRSNILGLNFLRAA